MVLPHPSWRRNGRLEHPQPRNALRKFLQSLQCAVARLIVHRNDFRDLRLRRQRLNASCNHRFFIAGRDNCADGSGRGHEDGLGSVSAPAPIRYYNTRMERFRRVLVWTGLALGFSLLVLFALPSYRQGEASIAGKTAEDFALTIDNKPLHLSDYRGKVVV